MEEKLYKLIDFNVLADEVIGHANISEIGDGTTRGAIKEIDGELATVKERLQTHDVDEKGLELFGWIAPVIGTVKDTIENGVYHKRIGRVDLASLNFSYSSAYNGFIAVFTNAKLPSSNSVVANILSDKYTATFANGFNGGVDKTISLATNGGGQIFVKDTSLGSTGKPSGILYYELATEQTVSIYNPNVLDTIGTTTNLLNPTLQSQVVNGVSITNNGDGTFTVNGTASESVIYRLQLNVPIKAGTYKLCGCPSGGSSTSYHIEYHNSPGDQYDIGNGAIIKFTSDTTTTFYIVITKGTTLSNLVFKPMITTNLQATYDDFVPYTGSTGKLNSDVAETKKDLNQLNSDLSNLGFFKTVTKKYEVVVNANSVGSVDLDVSQKNHLFAVANIWYNGTDAFANVEPAVIYIRNVTSNQKTIKFTVTAFFNN